MLKNLNKIAAGLLGLHGYPVEPFSWGPTRGRYALVDRESTLRAAPRAPAPAPAVRKETSVPAALHC